MSRDPEQQILRLLLMPLSQPDTGATAVLVDELDRTVYATQFRTNWVRFVIRSRSTSADARRLQGAAFASIDLSSTGQDYSVRRQQV